MIVKGHQAIARKPKKELTRYGYEVSSPVSTGEAASLQATADKLGLILMDIPTPMHGLERMGDISYRGVG